MDLWQLHIFCKVIELKSFSKAGEAIHLSQPTVSSHIKDLETHFSTRLVDRLARQAVPTKAGELLYDYAKRILALRDKAEAAMSEAAGKIRGHLTIGGSTIPAGYLLPRLVGLFSRSYPEVHISLIVGDSSDIMKKTAEGRIEVGVVGARSHEKHLQQIQLADDELRLVVPSAHKWAGLKTIAVQAIFEEPFIIREQGSGTLRSFQNQLQKKGFTIRDLNVVAEMGSTEAVRQAIKSNVGLSILSAIAVVDDIQAGLVKTLTVEGLDLKRSFYLTTHKQRTPSPLCRTFIQFLKQELHPNRP